MARSSELERLLRETAESYVVEFHNDLPIGQMEQISDQIQARYWKNKKQGIKNLQKWIKGKTPSPMNLIKRSVGVNFLEKKFGEKANLTNEELQELNNLNEINENLTKAQKNKFKAGLKDKRYTYMKNELFQEWYRSGQIDRIIAAGTAEYVDYYYTKEGNELIHQFNEGTLTKEGAEKLSKMHSEFRYTKDLQRKNNKVAKYKMIAQVLGGE